MINKQKDKIKYFEYDIKYRMDKQSDVIHKIQGKKHRLFNVYRKSDHILARHDIIHMDELP